jgi:cytochrome c556
LRHRLAARGNILRGLCSFALAALLLASSAKAEDKAPSTLRDEIFARKILMDSIDEHLDAIDWILSAGTPIDLAKANEHADTISIMLMAFPHLFPPNTNQWRPNVKRDPARDTFAAPELWTNFADFYRQAAAASRLAFTASRAKREVDFEAQVEALRNACAACHARYMKTGD